MPRELLTHLCPGGCGLNIPAHLLACRLDWVRLPVDMREAVYVAYRDRHRNPGPHRVALVAAWKWFREHPPAAVNPATEAVHAALNRPSR
jgi:hypothetical protein